MQFWAEWDIFLSQAYTAAAVAISCENTTHCVVTQAPAATQMSRCNNNDFVLSRLCMITVCELWALSMRPWPPYLAEEAFVGAHVCAYVPFFQPSQQQGTYRVLMYVIGFPIYAQTKGFIFASSTFVREVCVLHIALWWQIVRVCLFRQIKVLEKGPPTPLYPNSTICSNWKVGEMDDYSMKSVLDFMVLFFLSRRYTLPASLFQSGF